MDKFGKREKFEYLQNFLDTHKESIPNDEYTILKEFLTHEIVLVNRKNKTLI